MNNSLHALPAADVSVEGKSWQKFCFTVYRILILVAVGSVFFPGLNPGCVTPVISRNVSLLTESISYTSLTSNVTRLLMRGWIDNSVFILLQIFSLITLVGVILCAAGACMSFGNNKMKFVGQFFSLSGVVVMSGGLTGLYYGFLTLKSLGMEKVPAALPNAYFYFIVLTALILIASVLVCFANAARKNEREKKMKMHQKYSLFLMLLPILFLSFLFAYLPLWGWRYAFFDYTAGGSLSPENFVGLKWFTMLFQNEATRNDFFRVLKNTLAMSGLGLLTTWIPMTFAIFLTQVPSKRFRKVVQTLTTIPNFMGWVIVYAVALAIFSTDGFINSMIHTVTGMVADNNFLMSDSHVWLKMLGWNLWKGVGWSAIIYISSITSIDPGLYEAAEMDGAGRFQKIWYITVPSLLPTFFVLLIMAVANILSNGMDQYLVFSNAMNAKSIEVLDLYVYNLGIGNGQIPMSTAIGMFKSVISVILLFAANTFSKKVRGESII